MQSLRILRSVGNVRAAHLNAIQGRVTCTEPNLQQAMSPSLKMMPRARMPALLAAFQTDVAPTPRLPGALKPRIFTEYAIYKGKGAMCAKIIKPEWQETGSGDFSLSRQGTMFLEFAQVDTSSKVQNGYGKRSYNWSAKQTFALSVTEMANFIVSNNFTLIHDPNKSRPNEGTVLKTLKVSPMTDGTGGMMFNFTVKDPQLPGGQMYLALPLSLAEMAVLKSIANYVIPFALGFDQVFSAESTAQEPPSTQPLW